ncbi:hypothetical protein E2C01_102793 [Portunus trituberculatus]|uniref:Uncharacterized protein n=1 Tax=Portunus trituberculatus TaxID=210409 RepID=A0A5B7KPZ0_PORTR|nr:hypothetical protein [Portunus trituberculatus]
MLPSSTFYFFTLRASHLHLPNLYTTSVCLSVCRCCYLPGHTAARPAVSVHRLKPRFAVSSLSPAQSAPAQALPRASPPRPGFSSQQTTAA